MLRRVMKKEAILIFLSLFCSTLANAQTLWGRIVDTAVVRKQHELVLSNLDSARCFPYKSISLDPKNCIVCEVYNCHSKGVGLNFFPIEEGLIDTNMFSKSYFVSGQFLEDWVNLKEQSAALIDYIMGRDMFLFDTIGNKAYTISTKPTMHEVRSVSSSRDTIYQWYGYELHDGFAEQHFVGKLFKENTIDFAFCYPTFIDYEDPQHPFIAWNLSYCFAMKGNRFFYIDAINEKIYPLEEVVEDHWNWITNVVEKQ